MTRGLAPLEELTALLYTSSSPRTHFRSNIWVKTFGFCVCLIFFLHWLDVVGHIKYRLSVSVYKCTRGMAPQYLSELCTPVAEMPGRRHLRSAGRGQLYTPRFRLTNYGGRSFCCAAPCTWNCLPDSLKDTDLSLASFQKQLKTFLFSLY